MIEKEAIQKFVYGGGDLAADSESLFDAGVLDSLKLLLLIAFLEKEFTIKIKQRDLLVEKFDTIEQIASLVDSYKRGK